MGSVPLDAVVATIAAVLDAGALQHAMCGAELAKRVHLALTASNHMTHASDVCEATAQVEAVYAAMHGREMLKLPSALKRANIESEPAGDKAIGGFYWGFHPATGKTRQSGAMRCSVGRR